MYIFGYEITNILLVLKKVSVYFNLKIYRCYYTVYAT